MVALLLWLCLLNWLCNLFPNFLFMGRVSFTDLEHVRCLCQIVLDCLHGVSSQCQWFSASKVFETPIAALFSEAGDPFVHNFHDLCLCQSQQGCRRPMTIYCIHCVVQKSIQSFPIGLQTSLTLCKFLINPLLSDWCLSLFTILCE